VVIYVDQSFSQNNGWLDISSNTTVQFIVTDPSGKRTGEDPRGVSNPYQGLRLREIPGASYATNSVGDNPTAGFTPTPEDFGFEFGDPISTPSSNGVYAIEAIGTEAGKYSLFVEVTPKRGSNLQSFSQEIDGLTDKDQVTNYNFSYNGTPGAPVKFEKLVTQQLLHQDLDNSLKLNLLGNTAFYNSLSGMLTQFDQSLAAHDSVAARIILQNYSQQINAIPRSNDTTASQFVLQNADTVIQNDLHSFLQILPTAPPSPYVYVKLVNSLGAKLTGGSLQYYDGSWKPAVNNNDGTFTINIALKTVSLQMSYAYGVQTKSNVTVGSDTVVFQTVNAQVKLQNSQGSLMDTGTVQYYAGAWRNFGTTTSGVATMELLPINYSFSMTYAFASNNKAQDLSTNPIVVFQTTNTSVQLKNSQGNLMDTGTVQYYSGAWRAFGTTTNGVTTKELLPNSYSFSMTYAFANNNKQQDIGANSTVVFQTVSAAVQLKNSQGSLIDQGTVQYYSGAWRTFGTTSGGVTTKELLPNSYSFSMMYAFASNNKQQDLNSNTTVVFQTVNTTVQLKNSQGNLMDTGTVQYYSGAWRAFGTTTNGAVSLELLPNSYQFSMTYAYVSNNKTQDVGSNNIVSFSTVLATVNVINNQNNPVNNAVVTYYSGAWRQFGNTVNGNITKELLPASLQFRAQLGSVSQNKTQDLSANPLVAITLNQ